MTFHNKQLRYRNLGDNKNSAETCLNRSCRQVLRLETALLSVFREITRIFGVFCNILALLEAFWCFLWPKLSITPSGLPPQDSAKKISCVKDQQMCTGHPTTFYKTKTFF